MLRGSALLPVVLSQKPKHELVDLNNLKCHAPNLEFLHVERQSFQAAQIASLSDFPSPNPYPQLANVLVLPMSHMSLDLRWTPRL